MSLRSFGIGITMIAALLAGMSSAPASQLDRTGAPAVFRVGVAVENIDPLAPAYLGGYGAGPAGGTIRRHINPLTGKPEELTVRAIAIASRSNVIELASVDSQGWFAGYQEGPYGITDVRNAAAAYLRNHGAPNASSGDIIVSSLHEHAVPSLYGIFSPAAANLPYLKFVASKTTQALEEAFANIRPATITVGTADAPWLGGGGTAEGNEFQGWKRDGSLVALWAHDATTDETIATYVSEPAYPNIVFGPADLVGTTSETLISPDFPAYAEAQIEQRLGGVAILASGSLANQASPMQADIATSPDLPKVDGFAQTRAFDDIIQMGSAVANETFGALATGHLITTDFVGGADRHVVSVATNPADLALGYLNVAGDGEDWSPVGQTLTIYPDDRSLAPPYAYGVAFGTWVTTVRIGDLALVSEPGEYFGSIREALSKGIHAPDGVFVIGAAQDFLGYEYPAYDTPFTNMGGDELIFGPSVTLGDQTVTAGELEAKKLGFDVNPLSNAETTALENDYTALTRTGVYMLPSVVNGDLDASTGTFTPTLLAAADPAWASMTCDNPALLFTPPGCPLTDPSLGPFMWDFGDGASAQTPAEGKARASFSPFVDHSYQAPGVYQASVSVSAGGSTDQATLPITVNPTLHATISIASNRAVAEMQGGDGHQLFDVWTLPDGSHAYGASVPAPQSGTLTLTVIDGTGSSASTSLVF
ncbi:MAG: PKD domain-containing protein [Actinomycetota bacterium]